MPHARSHNSAKAFKQMVKVYLSSGFHGSRHYDDEQIHKLGITIGDMERARILGESVLLGEEPFLTELSEEGARELSFKLMNYHIVTSYALSAPLDGPFCLYPKNWGRIGDQFFNFANETGIEPPKNSLILGGACVSDMEKRLRWEEQVQWAQENGCRYIVESIPESDFTYASVISNEPSYSMSYHGGHDGTEKPILPDQEKLELLGKLTSNWHQILDASISESLRPVSFSGRKSRRLIIEVLEDVPAPWGTWTEIYEAISRKRKFTKFRENINRALSPHKVDHIDFKMAPNLNLLVD